MLKEWRDAKRHQRAQRALARQLTYQQHKSDLLKGNEEDVMMRMMQSSSRVRTELNTVKAIGTDVRVAEVGSGAHGLIFFFKARYGVGIDPLAADYARLFPSWQRRVPTIAALGERLPFADSCFEIVLCDNVIDHAEFPQRVVAELVRILAPGGLLYFTVNIHHPIYALASHLHGAWNALGVRYEIGPFADHTTHLGLPDARRLFTDLPLHILREEHNITAVRGQARKMKRRHSGDYLKQIFFKNALYRVIAERNP
jgi:SAM-dependent methyltransferase